MKAIKKGVEVIVATPGRLLDHMQRRTIDLSGIEQLILDEADRLMDMGFMPQVRRVVSKLPTNRQTLMFSATIDRRIEQIGSEFLRAPSVVRSSSPRIEPVEIEQRMYHVDEFSKDELLAQVLKENDSNSVLVFTQTRRKAAWVKARLRDSNVQAEEIHSDITQSQREKTLSRYRDGHFAVLVATDVASRGLDIPAIGLVVNYDLPNSAEDYVHRIGRTGRAGRSGVAISFVSSEQKHLIKDIETLTGRRLDMTAEHRSTQPFSRKPIAGRRFRPARRSRAV
jgi:ATP-dependent RNA helicase RhlE